MKITADQLLTLENWSPPVETPHRVRALVGEWVTPRELVELARGRRCTPPRALCAVAYLALDSDTARDVAVRVADGAAVSAGVHLYHSKFERPSYSRTRVGGDMLTYPERLALWESRHGEDGRDALVLTVQGLARDRPDLNGGLSDMHWDPCWWRALELALEVIE